MKGTLWAITAEALDFLMSEIGQADDCRKADALRIGSRGAVAGEGLEFVSDSVLKAVSGSGSVSAKISKDGIAVIPVQGILSKEGITSFWTGKKLSQGYRDIKQAVISAAEDPAVKAVVLKIDSPGGAVDGCQELASCIAEAGKSKPFYAFADGQATSAAYWIASAASHIAAPETAVIGSIGVRTVHADYSAWNEKAGVRYTHITAGDYKAAGNEDSPLDDSSLGYIRSQLQAIWDIFTRDVALNRGIGQQSVKNQQAKVFLADEAKGLGLVDAVVPDIDSYINWIMETEGIRMDRTELKAKHPALFDEIMQEARVEAEKASTEKISAAVENVLGLAAAVADQGIVDKIRALNDAGVDAKQAAAMKAIFGANGLGGGSGSGGGAGTGAVIANTSQAAETPEADVKMQILEALKSATPGAVSGNPVHGMAEPDFESLVRIEMASGKTRIDAMKAVQAAHPDLHEAWILKQQEAA